LRTIVAAASETHGQPLLNLLACCRRHEPGTRLVVYDLGLSFQQRAAAAELAQVRDFEFDRWPKHVRQLGVFGWKPIVVREVMTNGPVIYMDAGNLFWQPLEPIWQVLERDGLYVPLGKRQILEFCHPVTLQALKATVEVVRAPARHAALCGFSPRRQALVDAWMFWCLDHTVLAPLGSHRQNHLWDQGILSVLSTQLAMKEGLELEGSWFSVTRGNDDLTAEQALACLDCPRPW
jgi:hypothetical protein